MIFATQASGVRLQWVTVSGLENPPGRHHHSAHPPFCSDNPQAPMFPQKTWAGRPASLPSQTLEVYPAPSCSRHLPRPFNPRPWLRQFNLGVLTHRSNHKLAPLSTACHSITVHTAYSRLLQHMCICVLNTWPCLNGTLNNVWKAGDFFFHPLR